MNSMSISGIAQSSYHDDRTPIYLDVKYTNEALNIYNETFNWVIYMPPTYTESFQAFVDLKEQAVYDDITNKLQEWNALTPKTKEIQNIEGETITVDISREEIVCPTYPDYYVKRAMEYPTPANQLDAYWKGSPYRENMQAIIEEIKLKYPKDSI